MSTTTGELQQQIIKYLGLKATYNDLIKDVERADMPIKTKKILLSKYNKIT